MMKLRISEIFFSLQGESSTIGCPTIFIRLTGCPLRCHYCDTRYAFRGGQMMTIEAIMDEIAQYHTSYVTVTGGEPLAQPKCFMLLTTLCDRGYRVSLETSGALDVTSVDSRVIKIIDIKTPASGQVLKNRWENFLLLLPHDEIKFVIADYADYHWAKTIIVQHQLLERCIVLFSPVHALLSPQDLAEWILRDQLTVRFQIQLHKYLWGECQGR